TKNLGALAGFTLDSLSPTNQIDWRLLNNELRSQRCGAGLRRFSEEGCADGQGLPLVPHRQGVVRPQVCAGYPVALLGRGSVSAGSAAQNVLAARHGPAGGASLPEVLRRPAGAQGYLAAHPPSH
nr:hypothetical protein [Tanacetum cinerariifolium]